MIDATHVDETAHFFGACTVDGVRKSFDNSAK
jgi:hypothetical protein